MPGYDRTGPRGQGSMTGGGFGYCGSGRGNRRIGYRRFGNGFGHGRGAGYGRAYYEEPATSNDREKEVLKEEIEFLKKRLDELEKNEQE